MSRSGVWQLKKINIHFCNLCRSSSGVRSLIKNDLEKVKNSYPQVTFEMHERKNRRPFILAEYVNGRTKPIGVHYKSAKEMLQIFTKLRNEWGNKPPTLNKRVISEKVSIQGMWSPFLDLDNKLATKQKEPLTSTNNS